MFFKMPNPLQYKLNFWIIMCGIIYGFDKTQPLYVMALHFKDIL